MIFANVQNFILAHKPVTSRRSWLEIALASVWKVGIGLESKAFAHMADSGSAVHLFNGTPTHAVSTTCFIQTSEPLPFTVETAGTNAQRSFLNDHGQQISQNARFSCLPGNYLTKLRLKPTSLAQRPRSCSMAQRGEKCSRSKIF